MKKFLSICLVALCSVSAMYAQTASTATKTGVECDTEVEVSATSTNGYYHFKEWQIKDVSESATTILETLDRNGSATDGTNDYGATVSTAILPDGSNKDKSTLTLNPLSSALITAATSGTVTFEAFFDPDSYTINVTTEGSGKVSNTGNTNNDASTSLSFPATGNNPFTLTAIPDDNCTKFDHWEEDGTRIEGGASLTITPKEEWTDGSAHTYKAVFVKKTITIVVTTSDDTKGTVTIVKPTN